MYYGAWEKGKKEGFGQVVFPSDAQAFGIWHDDALTEGTYILPDGSRYVGQFDQSQFNGKGVLTLPDGTIMQGIWKAGKLVDGGKVTPDGVITLIH